MYKRQAYEQRKVLPKTAAVNAAEYIQYFEPWVKQGYDVVHVNLGGALSSSYQNCCLAAEELGHVYPVDSLSLIHISNWLMRSLICSDCRVTYFSLSNPIFTVCLRLSFICFKMLTAY